MEQVPLFWKLAISDIGELADLKQAGLEPVTPSHVTLLYIGGKVSNAKLASLNATSEEVCLKVQQALEQLQGQEFEFVVPRVLQHDEMIVAEVSLPAEVPCAKARPHLTLCRSPTVAPVFAQSLMDDPSTCTVVAVPSVRLRGVIELEMGLARPGQLRPKREADLAEGTWAKVKKHSSMGCAVVTFPTTSVRNAVLARCVEKMQLLGNALDVKPHMEKQSDGSKVEVPESIFVGWKQPKRPTSEQTPLCADDLLDLFEDICAH